MNDTGAVQVDLVTLNPSSDRSFVPSKTTTTTPERIIECYCNSIVSTDNAIASADNAIVSTDNAIVLTDNAIASADNAIVSMDNAIVSTDNAIASTDELSCINLCK